MGDTEIERLRRELAEARAAEQQRLEVEQLKRELEQAKREAALRSSPAPSPSPSNSGFSGSGSFDYGSSSLASENDKLRSQLDSNTISPSLTLQQIEHKKKIDELNRKKAELLSAPTATDANQANLLKAKQEELKKLQGLLAASGNVADLQEMQEQEKAKYQKKLYGVDVCFVMDCTGSMSPWINAARDKIVSLSQELKYIPARKPPFIRVAFLGYRDIDLKDKRYVPLDFMDFNVDANVQHFQSELAKVQPIGNQDIAEDVTGAMNYVLTKFAWQASTRLVIHFGDAPCHGKRYHAVQDCFPNGDPDGLVPEKLLEQFAAKSIFYYFGEICADTQQMTGIFKAHMASIGKPEYFVVKSMKAGPNDFIPAVVKSVTETMQQSAVFGM